MLILFGFVVVRVPSNLFRSFVLDALCSECPSIALHRLFNFPMKFHEYTAMTKIGTRVSFGFLSEGGRGMGVCPPCSSVQNHLLKLLKIKLISLTLSLILKNATLSIQFNPYSQLSYSISSVSSGN